MFKFATRHDPWWEDGQGARKVRTRQRVLGATSFALAIAACGLTAAVWISQLLPVFGATGFR
jgi:hypothetical protein